jgi:hypothetical protein
VIGGATYLDEPRPFGLALGDVVLDGLELRCAEVALNFCVGHVVHVFAYANADVDHRILGELALFLARELEGYVDFGGSLGVASAGRGKLLAIPYADSAVGETFHVSDAEFIE